MAIELKAVIFDYGNVLCAPQQQSDRQAMARVLNLPEADFATMYWRYRVAYDEAQLDAQSYWRKVAAGGEGKPGDTDIQQLVRIDVESWCRPSPVMVDWARRLREAGMRTAILSNMPMEIREYLTSSVDWMPPFDHMTFSCDIRKCKPDPAIYQHCLEGLGVPASEALFLDDRPENVDAARRLGLHSFVFTTAAEAVDALDGRYLLPAALRF